MGNEGVDEACNEFGLRGTDERGSWKVQAMLLGWQWLLLWFPWHTADVVQHNSRAISTEIALKAEFPLENVSLEKSLLEIRMEMGEKKTAIFLLLLPVKVVRLRVRRGRRC